MAKASIQAGKSHARCTRDAIQGVSLDDPKMIQGSQGVFRDDSSVSFISSSYFHSEKLNMNPG